MSTNCTAIIYVSNTLTHALGSFGSVITVLTLIGNITMLFYIRERRHKRNMFFFKVMLGISMLAVVIGQPLEIINILYKTTQLEINLASNFLLFFTFSGTYHCITFHTVERYLIMKQKDLLKTNLQYVIFIIIFLVFNIIINIPIFYNLYHIISSRHICEVPPPATMTVINMIVWVTYCSVTIYILSRKAVTFIRICDEFRKERFGKEDKTNVRRIVVMKRMWIVFSLLWLPYGCVNITQNLISKRTYEMANAISRIFAFLSFTFISAVYYKMDKNYSKYINKHILVIKGSFRKPDANRMEIKEGNSQVSSGNQGSK